MPSSRTSRFGTLAGTGKHLARQTLKRLGLHVQRYSPATVPEALLTTLIAHEVIDLVLDVGANAGQYARSLRDSGYRGAIVSFEPLSEAWNECAAHAAGDPLWSIAPRMALGATDGQIEIHVAKNSASSSILPMREAHRKAAPESAYVGREIVEIRRLDGVAPDALTKAVRPLLKIDTQGYEAQVLAGASGILPRIHGIQVEMSLTPLYDHSPTMGEMLGLLEKHGFSPYAILPAFIDPHSGRMLQVDGLFFREPSSGRR